MDIVPDEDFLSDFIESCSKGEDREREEVQSSSITPPPLRSDGGGGGEESDVWSDIEDALNRWTGRVLDVEARYSNRANFRQNIEEALRRQQQDGFLNHHDIAELRYIADLWVNLLNSISSYTIGCEFVKRDIITFLLELHKLRQISDALFIETCLQL